MTLDWMLGSFCIFQFTSTVIALVEKILLNIAHGQLNPLVRVHWTRHGNDA